MATCFTDEVFQDVAYKANTKKQILSGLDEFLDSVTVIPPGEWDPSIRIEPPETVADQNGRYAYVILIREHEKSPLLSCFPLTNFFFVTLDVTRDVLKLEIQAFQAKLELKTPLARTA